MEWEMSGKKVVTLFKKTTNQSGEAYMAGKQPKITEGVNE